MIGHWNWWGETYTENERGASRLQDRYQWPSRAAFLVMCLLYPFCWVAGPWGRRAISALGAWVDRCCEVRFNEVDRRRWVDFALAEMQDTPERVARCREILLGYPSTLKEDLFHVTVELVIESELAEKASKLGRVPWDELDHFLLGLEDGWIMEGVPWAVLLYSGRDQWQLLPTEYRWIKKEIIDANVTGRKELNRLILSKRDEARRVSRSIFDTPIEDSSEDQLRFREEYRAVNDRYFDIEHPEFVIRIPGQPVFRDRDAERKSRRSEIKSNPGVPPYEHVTLVERIRRLIGTAKQARQ
jgi:hypothetical protein